jgi:hypothetical protein
MIVEAGFGSVYNRGLDAFSAFVVCHHSGAPQVPALRQRLGAPPRQDLRMPPGKPFLLVVALLAHAGGHPG